MAATQTQQPQLLDPDSAFSVVYQNVYAPAFFEKVAHSYGYRPRSEAEMQEWLGIAAGLRERYEHEHQKVAQAGDPALAALRQQLGQPAQPVFDRLIKQAADRGAANPTLAHAVLSLQAHAAAAPAA